MLLSRHSRRLVIVSLISSAFSLASLTGCGGSISSADDDDDAPQDGYLVAGAMAAWLGSASSSNVNGTVSGAGTPQTVAGTMARSQPVTEVFEGLSGKRTLTNIDLSYVSAGKIDVVHRSIKTFLDESFSPRGTYDDGSGGSATDYAVVANLTQLPTALHANGSGSWFVLKHYKSSAKVAVVGVSTVDYAFAIVDLVAGGRLTVTMKNVDGNGAPVSTITSTYKIDLTTASATVIAPAKLLQEVTVLPNGVRTELNYS
ncbi:hypothetical protein ACS5PN_27030 [Roseateles sp. NT4]|uniref:hypothetical protein n=1 Tax=Roseateles sp. NT4 TaxID=3453715 RepID=UPI003EE95915